MRRRRQGLSESYFSSVFHACMGVTFSEYLLSYRLSLAKRMLEEGNMSSKEVGAACGFFSYSYFLTAFRQNMVSRRARWCATVKI